MNIVNITVEKDGASFINETINLDQIVAMKLQDDHLQIWTTNRSLDLAVLGSSARAVYNHILGLMEGASTVPFPLADTGLVRKTDGGKRT